MADSSEQELRQMNAERAAGGAVAQGAAVARHRDASGAVRLWSCRRGAALCILFGLLVMQLAAITARGFVKAPDSLECSGDVATHCHCMPSPAPEPAPVETAEETERTPSPPPVPHTDASPSAADYYSTWWVVMIIVVWSVSTAIVLFFTCILCRDDDDGGDEYIGRQVTIQLTRWGFLFCMLPLFIYIIIGASSSVRLALLGPAKGANETAVNVTNRSGQMIAVTPTASEYYSSAGIAVCIVGLSVSLCAACICFRRWVTVRSDYPGGLLYLPGILAPVELEISVWCCVCWVVPFLVFVLLGLNPAAREKLLPTKLVINNTGTSSPSVPRGPVWTAGGGSQWCGLTSCASVESMLDFLFPSGRPSRLSHMLHAATGLGATAAGCQGMSILIVLHGYSIGRVSKAHRRSLGDLTGVGFCTELSAWAVLAALYAQDACDDGFALKEAVTLGPSLPFLVAVNFLWPCALCFALMQARTD